MSWETAYLTIIAVQKFFFGVLFYLFVITLRHFYQLYLCREEVLAFLFFGPSAIFPKMHQKRFLHFLTWVGAKQKRVKLLFSSYLSIRAQATTNKKHGPVTLNVIVGYHLYIAKNNGISSFVYDWLPPFHLIKNKSAFHFIVFNTTGKKPSVALRIRGMPAATTISSPYSPLRART